MLATVAVIEFAEAQPTEFRVDTFDARGNRSGYFVIDTKTGRVDRYDTKSNHLGYGQATTSGRIDLYDTKSNRTGYGTVTPFRSNGNGSKR
jgi:hypothetical protein